MNEIDYSAKPINKKLIYDYLKQDIVNLANIKNRFNEAIKRNQMNSRLFLKVDNSIFYKTNNKKYMSLNSKQSKKELTSFEFLEKKIYKRFYKLYRTNIDFYNIKIINEIISNDNSHIVAVFKDFLIKDDYSEFIQKYYHKEETIPLLKQIFEYYKLSSVVYPNYILLSENKYIYRNIQKKQKIIDDQQELEEKDIVEKNNINWIDKSKQILDKSEKVFDSKIIDSILNQSNTSQIQKCIFGVSNESSIDCEYKNLINLVKNINNAEEKFYAKFMEKNKLINNNNNVKNNNKNNNNKDIIKNSNLKEEQNINIDNGKTTNKAKQFINTYTNTNTITTDNKKYNSRNNQNINELFDFAKTHFNFSSNLSNLRNKINKSKKFYSSYINKDKDKDKENKVRIKTPLNVNKDDNVINYKLTNSINQNVTKNEHKNKNNKLYSKNKIIDSLNNEINSLNKNIKNDWSISINNNLVKNKNNIEHKKSGFFNSNEIESNKKKLLYIDNIPCRQKIEIIKKKSNENNSKYIKKSVINELLSLCSSGKETWRESKIIESQRLSYSINKTDREKKTINSKQKILKNNNKNISVLICDNNAYKYINNTTRTATKNKDISLEIDSDNNRKIFFKNSCNDVSHTSKNKLKNNYNIGFNLEINTNNNRNTITSSRDEEEYLGTFTKKYNYNLKNDNKYNLLNSKDKILKNKSIKIKKNNEQDNNNDLILNNKKNNNSKNSRNKENLYNKKLTYGTINMKHFLNTNNSLNLNNNNNNINNRKNSNNNIVNNHQTKISHLKEIKDNLKLNLDSLRQSGDLYKKIETNKNILLTKKNNNNEINVNDIKNILNNNKIKKNKKQNRLYPLSARELNTNNDNNTINNNNNNKNYNRVLKSNKSNHKTLKNSLNETGVNDIVFGYSNSYKNKNKYVKKIQTAKMSDHKLILSNLLNKKDEDKNMNKQYKNSATIETNSLHKKKKILNNYINNNSDTNTLLINNLNNSLNNFSIKNRSRNINENNNLKEIKTVINVNYDENMKNNDLIKTPIIRKKIQQNICNSNKKINNSINEKNTRYYNIEVNIHNNINNKTKNKDKNSINKINNNLNKQHIKLNSTQFSTGSLNINFNNYTNNFCVNYNNNYEMATNQSKSKNNEKNSKYTKIESKNYKYKRIKNIKNNLKGLQINELDKLSKKNNIVPLPFTDRNKKVNLLSPLNNYPLNMINKIKKK